MFFKNIMINPVQLNNNILLSKLRPCEKQNFSRNFGKDSVSFSGVSREISVLLPYLKNLRQSMDIFSKAQFISSGLEGSVYKLKDIDFCIKIPHHIGVFGKWSTKISERDKLNHVVASSEKGAVIMRYLPGKDVRSKPDVIYTLPNSSYRSMLQQISEAYKHGLAFDAAGTNVIYNPAQKSLTPIDFQPLTAFSVHYPFTSAYNALSCPNTSVNPNAFQNNKILLGKLLNILLEEIQTPGNPKITIKPEDIEYLFDKYETKLELTKDCMEIRKIIQEILLLKSEKVPQTMLLTEKIKNARDIIKSQFSA